MKREFMFKFGVDAEGETLWEAWQEAIQSLKEFPEDFHKSTEEITADSAIRNHVLNGLISSGGNHDK